MPDRTPPPWAVLTGASAAQAAVSFVTFGLPAIGPELRHAYGLSLAALGAILTANLLGSGLALVGAGVAFDRFGPRRSTQVGVLLAALGLAAAAPAHSGALVFAGLLVSGVGSSVVPVAGAGAMFDHYPATRRAWALGVRQMAVPLGGTIGAVSLPSLEKAGGTRLVLLVGLALIAVTGLVFSSMLSGGARPSRPPRAFRIILRAPGMPRLLAVACVYIVVLQALLAYVVPAVRAAGFSPLEATVAYGLVNVTAMVARVAWGRIADREGGTRRGRTLVETGAVAAAGAALLAAALHLDVAAVFVAATVFAFGALGWNAVVYTSAGEAAPRELATQSFAVAATVVFVVSAVCTPALGALAARTGWDAFWLTTAGLAAAGMLLAAGLRRPDR